MANALFAGASVGLVVLPLMIFHQLQLMACAALARRYALRARSAGMCPAHWLSRHQPLDHNHNGTGGRPASQRSCMPLNRDNIAASVHVIQVFITKGTRQ